MRARRSSAPCPNRRPKKSMFLEDAQRRIEVAAETLRHIGDAAADLGEVADVADILVEDQDLAGLNGLDPGDQPEQRRFAHPVRSDYADHDARRDVDRDVVERDGRAITVRHAIDPRDGLAGHLAAGVLSSEAWGAAAGGAEAAGAAASLALGGARTLTLRSSGQATSALVRTKPMPRMPVLTLV